MSKKTSGKADEPKFVLPKTYNQREWVNTLEECVVSVCYGPAGTGKTLVSLSYAAEQLHKGLVDKIIICRSIIGADGDIGYLPGSVTEKIAPYMMPYKTYLEEILGKKYYLDYASSGKIQYMPIETIRGSNWHRTIAVCDETQNVSISQLKCFLTRMGRWSKSILLGDNRQSDVHPSRNGLQFIIDRFTGNVANFGMVEFDKSDILRNPMIADILEIFENDDNGPVRAFEGY